MTTIEDTREIFKKLDAVVQKVSDVQLEVVTELSSIKVDVARIQVGQEGLADQFDQMRKTADKTNEITQNCLARQEWTGFTRRVEVIENKKSIIPSPNSKGGFGTSLAFLRAYGPWIIAAFAAIGATLAGYSQAGTASKAIADANKANVAATAAVDTAIKAAKSIAAVGKAVDRIEKAIDTDESLKTSSVEH